eukprot:3902387-Pyramimonas_sp.AAC.1
MAAAQTLTASPEHWFPGSAPAAMAVLGRSAAWRFGLRTWTKAKDFTRLLGERHMWHGTCVRHARGD